MKLVKKILGLNKNVQFVLFHGATFDYFFLFLGHPILHDSCFKRNVHSPGNDVTHYENILSSNDCQQLCKGHKECSYFTFDSKTLNCWMKSIMAAQLQQLDGAIFGPKECGKTANQ